MISRTGTAVTTLELEPVLRRPASLTRSAPASRKIRGSEPFTSAETLAGELGSISEMRELLDFDDPFPFEGFDDLEPWLTRAETSGAFLDGPVFISLYHFLAMSRRLLQYLKPRAEKFPLLWKTASSLTSLEKLEKAIAAVAAEDGSIRDTASGKLAEIRRELQRLENTVSRHLQSVLKKMIAAGHATENTLAVRQGRPVIPMLESRRSRLNGVIVDQSASGTTVYVEPLEVVEMRNHMTRLRQQETREIERLLRELTDLLRPDLLHVETNFHTAVSLDVYMAKAAFAAEMQALPAETSGTGMLQIKNGRHPLLLMRTGRDNVVPLNLSLGGDFRTIVVTGPNAGGKTVALKTAGLLSLMHAWGYHVPADSGTSIPLFDSMFADIGDRQSIEQDLSTFSSHISHIQSILAEADGRSLVLLDEIGSATDPDEGAALAETILSELTAAGCLTIATTHIGALKVFAHEHPGVENGSMAFDQQSLRPAYRFQIGIPGSSYAFEIAERLGLEKKLVQAARELLGEDRGHVERLIQHLEDELSRARELKLSALLKESELSGLVSLYRERSERLKTQGAAQKAALLQQAEDILADANAAVERVVREIREHQADKETVRRAKEEVAAQQKRVRSVRAVKTPARPLDLRPGDWVKWPGQGGRGKVLAGPDKSGRVRVQWDDFTLQIPAADLKKTGGPKGEKKSSSAGRFVLDAPVRDEVDLRGMTAVEAAEAVEKYLGDARMTGYQSVRIIHGKGGGVLRREVSRLLKGHPLVASQRPGSWNEGDTGVTIVELKR